MKKAVMYGAGNIGRGFMGQLFCLNGYETQFIDINRTLIDQLNTQRRYPIKIVSNEAQGEVFIENACCVDGADINAAAEAIAQCDLMSIAVGVNLLPKIVPVLAEGLRRRSASGHALNLILCENKINVDIYLRELVRAGLPEAQHGFLDSHIGFIEASVGRMVPVVTEEMRGDNPLRVWVEPFCQLPIDKDAFKGEIPLLEGIVPESGFAYFIQRKLYMHNMGHCLCAYLGRLNGYRYIYETMENETIRSLVQQAMYTSARALAAEHGRPLAELAEHADDLLHRFGNRYLGDTVERVGRDLQRKLGPEDRLLGAIALCKKHDIDALPIKLGVAAALLFGEEYLIKDVKL